MVLSIKCMLLHCLNYWPLTSFVATLLNHSTLGKQRRCYSFTIPVTCSLRLSFSQKPMLLSRNFLGYILEKAFYQSARVICFRTHRPKGNEEDNLVHSKAPEPPLSGHCGMPFVFHLYNDSLLNSNCCIQKL